MFSMIISTKFTHADLLAIPNDGKRREIVDGELIVTPAPKLGHQEILLRLALAFGKYLEQHPIGKLIISPMDVILSDFDVLEPDLLLVLNEQRGILQDWVRGAPDMVIEILSPTTVAHDRGAKLKAYAKYGVGEYWIVVPEGYSIEVYRLGQGGFELARTFQEPETLSSRILPDFSLPVASIFVR